jgi:hypothetical protein
MRGQMAIHFWLIFDNASSITSVDNSTDIIDTIVDDIPTIPELTEKIQD